MNLLFFRLDVVIFWGAVKSPYLTADKDHDIPSLHYRQVVSRVVRCGDLAARKQSIVEILPHSNLME
jgi:hypothetical protein